MTSTNFRGEIEMNARLFTLVAITLCCCCTLIPSTASGQTNESGIAPVLPSASAASYYYISKPGELTMQVNIWGSIRNPGRYEIPLSTDLVQLVSYAGGPNVDATLDQVRLTHVVRKDSAVSREEVVVDLDHLNKLDEKKLVLRPGDTIFIDHSGWSSFRDVLAVVTTAAIVITAVSNVVIAQHH